MRGVYIQSKIIILTVAIIFISGCATSPEQLKTDSKFSTSISIGENYQVVYRRTLDEARACLAGAANLVVSNEVDGRLFSDLGFGEIVYYQKNIRPIYYATIKITKTSPEESRVTIYTGGQPEWASKKLGQQFIGWAQGQRCR